MPPDSKQMRCHDRTPNAKNKLRITLIAVGNPCRRVNCIGVEDDYSAGTFPSLIPPRVDDFNDGITRFEMQRFSICGKNREFPADKGAGIYHRMAVSLRSPASV
jgi:hypothetical protein